MINSSSKLLSCFLTAEKYGLAPLSIRLGEKLIKNLSIDNVLETYESMNRFQKPEIMEKIVSFIQDNTLLILEHESFIRIHRKTLNFVLSQQKLNAVEIQLFHASLRWAKAECERNSIPNQNPNQLRKALGNELFLIGIPTMSVKHFMGGPTASQMFDFEEQQGLLNYILGTSNQDSLFDFVLRFRLDKRNRSGHDSLYFDSKFNTIFVKSKVKDVISTLQFKSSGDFLLHGFSFGSVKVR